MGNEDVIVFDEGGWVRSLRGIIIEETDEWVKIQRRDGNYEIARRLIIKIERRRGAAQ
jgi:hypothetical protein